MRVEQVVESDQIGRRTRKFHRELIERPGDVKKGAIERLQGAHCDEHASAVEDEAERLAFFRILVVGRLGFDDVGSDAVAEVHLFEDVTVLADHRRRGEAEKLCP